MDSASSSGEETAANKAETAAPASAPAASAAPPREAQVANAVAFLTHKDVISAGERPRAEGVGGSFPRAPLGRRTRRGPAAGGVAAAAAVAAADADLPFPPRRADPQTKLPNAISSAAKD